MTEKKLVCPECGSSEHYKKGFNARGKQRYQCKNCGYNFVAPENHAPQRPRPPCRRCGSLNVILYGRTLLTGFRSKQRYKCKDCGRSFYEPVDVKPKGDSRGNLTDQYLDGESPGNSSSTEEVEAEADG